MKRSYLWSWPLVVLSILIGFHILFTNAPIDHDYKVANANAEIIKQSSKTTSGTVLVVYDYTDNPNMGTGYGADISYSDGENSMVAWIGLVAPTTDLELIEVLYNDGIPNFAVNSTVKSLPQEIPNVFNNNLAIALLIIPSLYIIMELLLMVFSRMNNRPQNYHQAEVIKTKQAMLVGIFLIVKGLIGLSICAITLSNYMAATERVVSVRAENSIVIASLDPQCMERPDNDICSGRYRGLYSVGDGNFNRLFHVKGKIMGDERLKSLALYGQPVQVPLLYGKADPRFSYALSSNEQVNPPYDTFELLFNGGVLAGGAFLLFASVSQKKRESKV